MSARRIARPLTPRILLTSPVIFQVGRIKRLLDSLRVLGNLPHQLFPRAREIAHGLNRCRWHEAAADQAMRQQVGDPGRILHIALASGYVADVRGIRQRQRERLFEQIPNGFPIRAGGFHRDVRHAVLGQPCRQRQQLSCRHPERAALLLDGSSVDPHTRDERIFGQIEARTPRIQNLHDLVTLSASARSPPERSLRRVLQVARLAALNRTGWIASTQLRETKAGAVATI